MNLISSCSINFMNSGYDYIVDFAMPANCTCRKITSGGKNVIEVILPAGQNPSPTLMNKQISFAGGSTGIAVDFDQICNGVSLKKPTMVVTL